MKMKFVTPFRWNKLATQSISYAIFIENDRMAVVLTMEIPKQKNENDWFEQATQTDI